MIKKNWSGVKYVLYFLFLLVGIILYSELGLRIYSHFQLNYSEQATLKYQNNLRFRILNQWLAEKNTNPLLPPYKIYENQKYSDDEYLQKIVLETKLPANQTWEGYDYFQKNEDLPARTYQVHSNSLGFRGKEVSAKKEPRTTRILTIGSNQAFGFGVNDAETYSAQLEVLLNQKFKNRKFEVWNAGTCAGTAVVGLAKLKHELLQFQPDFLIVDFGQFDPNSWFDRLNLNPLLKKQNDEDLSVKLLRRTFPIIGNSFIFNKYAYSLNQEGAEIKRDLFFKIIREIQAISSAKKIPLILIKQIGVSFQNADYLQISNSFIDVISLLKKYPDAKNDEIESQNRKSWYAEVPLEARKLPFYQQPSYRMSFYTINEKGHAVLANEIVNLLTPMLNQTLNRK